MSLCLAFFFSVELELIELATSSNYVKTFYNSYHVSYIRTVLLVVSHLAPFIISRTTNDFTVTVTIIL